MYVCVYECKGCRIVKYANTPQTRCRILLHKHGAGLSHDAGFYSPILW